MSILVPILRALGRCLPSPQRNSTLGTQDSWEQRGLHYAERVLSPCYRLLYADLVDRTLAQQPQRVLEFGCGDAMFLRTLAAQAPTLTLSGYDYAASQIAAARTLLPGATFAVADITRLPEPDRTFDVAVGVGVLMYLMPAQLDAALGELARVSSCVIAAEMDCRFLSTAEKARFRRANDGRYDHDYAAAFAAAGYAVEVVEPVAPFFNPAVNTAGEMGYGLIVARSP